MAFRTVEEITREAARLIQARLGQNYQTKQLREFAQQEWEAIWNERDWPESLRVDTATIAASSDDLVLPRKYDHLVGQYGDVTSAVWYPLFDSKNLAIARLQQLYRGGPEAIWESVDRGYFNAAHTGDKSVLLQPVAAEQLKLVSSAAADISMTIRIIGEDSSGNFLAENLATNGSDGTTAVTSTGTYAKIDAISTGATNKTGRFTVTGNTSTSTYAVIEPWQTAPRYAWYQLGSAPDAATTLYFVGKLRHIPFASTIETPVIEGVDMVMVYGIAMRAMLEKRQAELAHEFSMLRMSALGKRKSQIKEPNRFRMLRG